MSQANYPILLTPGPLTTSDRTRQALLRDWGSWDSEFNQITARIRTRVLDIVHGQGTHECVPMQGSGTFSVEAAIGTLVPHGDKGGTCWCRTTAPTARAWPASAGCWAAR